MGTLRQNKTEKTKPTVQQQAKSSDRRDIHPVEELQEMFGNRALGRLISSQSLPPLNQISTANNSSIQRRPLFRGLSHELTGHRQANLVQAKLTVNQPGDKYEQEADRVAAQVVKQINNPISQPLTNPETEAIQSQKLMRKSAPNPTQRIVQSDVEASLQKARGKGQSLPENLQQPLEQAFNADFRQVRIHTNAQADKLNKSLQAKAFTTGKDIFFRQGEYKPSSQQGQELIAHELTHVVQQNNGLVQRNAVIQKKNEKDKSKVITERNGKTKAIENEKEITKGIKTEIKKIDSASPEQIEKAVELMVKIGFFGEDIKKKQVESDISNYSSETSIRKSLGINNKTEFKALMDIVEGFSAIAQASSTIGLDAEILKKYEIIIGGFQGDFKAKLNAFIGIKGAAKGEVKLGELSLELSGEAGVKAGAEGIIETEVIGKVGNIQVKADLEGRAFAGAEAKTEGKLRISKSGISLSAGAEARAGATASAKGSTSLKYKGKELVKLSGQVEAQVGTGAKVKWLFEYNYGQITLGGGLGSTLGIGGGASGYIQVDVIEITTAIIDTVEDAIQNRSKIRKHVKSGASQIKGWVNKLIDEMESSRTVTF